MLRRHSGLLTSDFPAEGDAMYQYDGAGKRRQRAVGGGATKYRWDIGWNVLNEEDSGGNLTRTYVGRSAAHVDGANPSTGAWRFYVHDHLGSTRGVYDANKTPYAAFEHTPYGELYASSGSTSDITRRYTGHDWDDAAQFYYAPYRYYAPGLGRWMTRDPLGMVDGPNVYGYVRNVPQARSDSLGLRFGGKPTNVFEAFYDIWQALRNMGATSMGYLQFLAAIPCMLKMGTIALNADPNNADVLGTGGSYHQHCFVSCRIEQECGHGTGKLAAHGIEWLEHFDFDGRSVDLLDIAAGEKGALIGKNPCADCNAECNKNSWGMGL